MTNQVSMTKCLKKVNNMKIMKSYKKKGYAAAYKRLRLARAEIDDDHLTFYDYLRFIILVLATLLFFPIFSIFLNYYKNL